MITNSNILQIHIPKTGGTSVNEALFNKKLGQNWVRIGFARHDSYLELKRANDLTNAFVFSIVRNPFTRTYSYYHHFLLVNNFSSTKDLSFKDFLMIVKEKKFYPRTPLISFDQSHFLIDEDLNVTKNLTKIYKYENLNEFENDFDCKLKKNKVGNYNRSKLFDDYTDELIDFVRTLYKRDFTNFNYSQEFTEQEVAA